ncbi:hypothetical protein AAG906_013081 [Vitis piasezkii]
MKPWIVDTGASDHMTGDLAIFKITSQVMVIHPSILLMVQSQNCGIGSIKLTKDLYLDSSSMFQTWIVIFSCSGSTSSHVANSQTKSLKQVAYSLRFAKHTRTVYPQIPYKPSTVFSLVHSDVWGPSRIKNISGTRWFVTFVDDHTRITWVFLMKEKSRLGTFSNLQSYGSKSIQFQNSSPQVDNAKEYFTSSLKTYLQNHKHYPHKFFKNRHLLEVARCLMFSSNVPNYFGEAILTATYLINRMPSECLPFNPPSTFLKTISSHPCCLLIYHSKYLVARHSFMCILKIVANLLLEQIRYKCYSPTNKRFYTTMGVSFYPKSHVRESMNEHQVWESLLEVYLLFTRVTKSFPIRALSCPHPCRHHPASRHTNFTSGGGKEGLEHGLQSTCGQYIDSIQGVRRCTDHPIGNYVTYEGLSPSYRAFATSLDDTQVPNTIQEALKISEWKKVVQDEIDALEKNGTWTITDLPVGKRPVGYYQETFAPVAKLNTIRILLSLAVNQDWCLQQLDIKNAFLNGDLEEEVYMEIPHSFKKADHTLFVKKSHAGKMAILIVYVDDIILSRNDMEELQNLKKYLSEEFEVKDLGNLKYFLGMEVARSRKGIVVSQRKYILDLLKGTGMLVCKPINTPMDSRKKLGIAKESSPVRGDIGDLSGA